MMQALAKSMIPLALQKLKEIAPADKLKLVSLIRELADCYLNDERDEFENIVNTLAISDETKALIISAVWD